jgi:hypothetical protein
LSSKKIRLIALIVIVVLSVLAVNVVPGLTAVLLNPINNLQLINQSVLLANQPKIVMARTPLESPRGMLFYETRVLPLRNDLIQRFGKNLSLRNISLNPSNIQPIIRVQAQAINTNLSQPLTTNLTVPSLVNKNIVALPKIRIYDEAGQKFTRLIVNETRGHIVFTPKLSQLALTTPILLNRQAAQISALRQVNDLKLVPVDVSKIAADQVVTLGRTEIKNGQSASTKNVIQTVNFRRLIGQKPVLGAGSRLSIDLGNNGQLVGFNRSWNQLVKSNLQPVFKNSNEVFAEIEKNLKQKFTGPVELKVSYPRLVYFGNDQKYVQPVYMYTVEIINSNKNIKNSFLNGLILVAKNSPEIINLSLLKNVIKEKPIISADFFDVLTQPAVPTVPSIGRYVVRNDHPAWTDDANEFKAGLVNNKPADVVNYTFGDYYWDEPRMWTTQESSFVDKWNITMVQGHGANWLFTTKGSGSDVVNLNDPIQPGYGDNYGSSMRYLILKGCSILPSAQDRADWPNPWWRIFKGLRMAVGYRTTMYIDDNVGGHFAEHLAQRSTVLDSWFHSTGESSGHLWNRQNGGAVTGYPAVVMIPGHENDTIYDLAAAPPATSTGLVIYWQY